MSRSTSLFAATLLCAALAVPCRGEGTPDAPAPSTGTVTLPPAEQSAAPAHIDNFPRITEVSWEPVPGAHHYGLEVDAFNCRGSGKWCSETGKMPLTAGDIKAPNYTFFWPADKKGRWRFWAVEADGTEHPKCDWRDFPAAEKSPQGSTP